MTHYIQEINKQAIDLSKSISCFITESDARDVIAMAYGFKNWTEACRLFMADNVDAEKLTVIDALTHIDYKSLSIANYGKISTWIGAGLSAWDRISPNISDSIDDATDALAAALGFANAHDITSSIKLDCVDIDAGQHVQSAQILEIHGSTDIDRLFVMLESELKNKNGDAYCEIGKAYYFIGETDNAIAYFEEASSLGSATAQNYIGRIYFDAHDYVTAKEMFEKAASQHIGEAHFWLSLCHEKSLSLTVCSTAKRIPGNARTHKQAKFEHMQLAAEAGVPMAAFSRGFFEFTTENYSEARRFFQMVADKGSRVASVYLSYMYANGLGGHANNILAIKLLSSAPGFGDVDAFFEDEYGLPEELPIDGENGRFNAEMLDNFFYNADANQLNEVYDVLGAMGYCEM